jgi:hypothetical protein
MGIRDKLAQISEERSQKQWDAREQDATAGGARAEQFLQPGEQLQVVVPGLLRVPPPPSSAGATVGRAVENVAIGLLLQSEGVRPSYDDGIHPQSTSVEVVIAVTDRAIIVIRSDDEPAHGTYGRYPRNMHFSVKSLADFQHVRLGYSELDAPIHTDHDWGRWEDMPPSDQFHYGTVETALGKANAALDTMIANNVIDAAANSPQAQQRTDAPRQGWYPDPAGGPEFRYWDGSQWDLSYWDGRQPPERQDADAAADSPQPDPPPAAPPPPGWYPDPSGAPGTRYWDGSRWNLTAQPPAQ